MICPSKLQSHMKPLMRGDIQNGLEGTEEVCPVLGAAGVNTVTVTWTICRLMLRKCWLVDNNTCSSRQW